MICILGPTACGKTHYAVQLATEIDGEILSADSRQVFRGMDIGTGKDLNEYSLPHRNIPYHLIDICDAGSEFSVFDYVKAFTKAYDEVAARQKTPILCGGTGLYLSAILQGYHFSEVPINPDFHAQKEKLPMESLVQELKSLKTLHNQTDIATKARCIRALEIALFSETNPKEQRHFPCEKIIGLAPPRELVRQRITQRLQKRLQEGLLDEVKDLLNLNIPAERLLNYGLEYRYVTLYLLQEISFDELFQQLNTAIHQFAKRQMTWFRRMEKQGLKIDWVNPPA